MDEVKEVTADTSYRPQKVAEMEKDVKASVKEGAYKPMTIGDWLIAFLIQFVPVIGLLMTLYWAVSRRTQPSKRTWAQALLVLYTLIAGMIAVFYTALWGFFIDIFDF